MPTSTSDDQIATHPDPVWRDRANFLVSRPLRDNEAPLASEQLWARQVAENEFEICCIPFFPFDLALGDVVKTSGDHLVVRVLRPSGHSTFRVWFGDSNVSTARDQVIARIKDSHLFEWFSPNLLAIDSDENHVQALADYLGDCEGRGLLVYETGRQETAVGGTG